MAISVWFLMDLRSLQDRGLNPTFDDVLNGMDAARDGTRVSWKDHDKRNEIIDEEKALARIEDACRRRRLELSGEKTSVPAGNYWGGR